MADIIREHWVEKWEHPSFCNAVRCMAEGCTWEGQFPGDIAEHVAEVLEANGYGDKAAAWESGAVTAWEASGEGWNGEYPGEPFSNNEIKNPYL